MPKVKVKHVRRKTVPVPDDEMLLAKLIQNAKASGMKRTKGALYRTANSKVVWEHAEARSCCAIGAALITKLSFPNGMWEGNDGLDCDTPEGSGYDIGRSWYHAMGK